MKKNAKNVKAKNIRITPTLLYLKILKNLNILLTITRCTNVSSNSKEKYTLVHFNLILYIIICAYSIVLHFNFK